MSAEVNNHGIPLFVDDEVRTGEVAVDISFCVNVTNVEPRGLANVQKCATVSPDSREICLQDKKRAETLELATRVSNAYDGGDRWRPASQ
ncbi:hypothetical protein LTR11_012123, partial [Exophiala xenobiotica]